MWGGEGSEARGGGKKHEGGGGCKGADADVDAPPASTTVPYETKLLHPAHKVAINPYLHLCTHQHAAG